MLFLLINLVSCHIHVLLSVTITNHNNLQYTGTLSIGQQQFELLFDTGSSITWVCKFKII